MRDEVVVRNVAKLVQVTTPRYDVGRGLSVEQARMLLAEARSDRLSALYVLAVYLGLRRGELLVPGHCVPGHLCPDICARTLPARQA